MRSPVSLLLSIAVLALCAILLPSLPLAAGEGAISDAMKSAATSGQAPAGLVVVYDDMHGFHGGTTIEIAADGKASRRDVNRGQESQTTIALSADQMRELLLMLVQIEAWNQHTAERTMVPDESQAKLELRLGDEKAGFWEFFNEMEENKRLSTLKKRLDELIPAAAP